MNMYEFYRAVRRVSPYTIGEYNELSILSLLQRNGPHRVTAIAEQEGLTQPGATTILRRLTEQGLVKQASDKADARVTLATITPAGIARLENIERMRTGQLEAAISRLPPGDQQALDRANAAIKEMTRIIRDEEEVANHG